LGDQDVNLFVKLDHKTRCERWFTFI